MFDIAKYESVAMLRLSGDERELLGARASDLEDSFNALGEIDANGIEPLVTVLKTHTVLREDVAFKLLARDEIMANAPEQHDGYFQVPLTRSATVNYEF